MQDTEKGSAGKQENEVGKLCAWVRCEPSVFEPKLNDSKLWVINWA